MKPFIDWFMQFDPAEKCGLCLCALVYGMIIAYIIDNQIKKGRSSGPFKNHK